MRNVGDKLIITHLLAFIAGVVVAYFALPTLQIRSFDSAVIAADIDPSELGRLQPIEARIAERRQALKGRLNAVELRTPLIIPVQGVRKHQLVDTYTQSRGTDRVHNAIDIMAPEGTPVLAAADGRIVKLWTSDAGGITVYQFNPGRTLSFYYAHLSRYAPQLTEGMTVRKGEVIGYVGYSGNANAEAPHLHFAVNKLPPDANWSDGDPVNPYPLLTGSEATP